jgi:hypothetical protein
MSLYTTAQAEPSFYLASNLDTSASEYAKASGLTVSNTLYGTITQNANSLTGNASFDFSSNGRSLFQTGYANGNTNIIEIVFKKSSTPASDVGLIRMPGSTIYNDGHQIILTSNGYIRGNSATSSNGTTVTGTTNLCDGKFHHVVWAYNNVTGGGGARLYVDGTLIGSSSTYGNVQHNGNINIGSYISNTGTASLYSEATIDFVGIYRPSSPITNTNMDTFVANHLATFANKTFEATALTASALSVTPALVLDGGYLATPATASAASGAHFNSTRDSFTLLDTYMGTLSLEQWYKFNDEKNIINYGSGGAAAFYFDGNATSSDHGGIQGSGALRICGNDSDGAVYITLDDYTTMSPEITDGDFSIGFWVKAPSAVASNPAVVYAASNYNDGTYTSFIIHNSGKLEFQMYTNSFHGVQTAASICDNNWHLAVGKYNSSTNTMSFYLDNTLVGTETVNAATFSPPNFAAFGSNNQASNGNFFSVSNFFISSSSAISTTVMGNMITYSGGAALQAYANMEQPKFSSNNSFNNLTETRGALVDLRFNESTGSPLNYGTAADINLAVTGDSVTYNQISPNTKAYKITNTAAKISSVADFAPGTFSTNNAQTLMVYAKVDTGSEPSVINIFGTAGHFGGPYGSGLGVYMMGSGAIRARLRDGGGSNTINSAGTYADSKYHLYTVTTDGSTVKLYIDGVLEGSTSTTKTLTDYGLIMVGGEIDTFGVSSESKSTYIDELSIYNFAFSASQVFDHFQALSWPMDWTASASLPAPTYSAGFGPTINGTAYTVNASFPNVFPFVSPATANGLFQNPNYEAIDTVYITADPMTASAQAENPGWNIGEINTVLHMDASAEMGDARARIPGVWNASPAIANPAVMVEPAFSSTRGALIKPQSLNANAFFSLPPAYYLVTDDIWYQRLLDVDYQSSNFTGPVTFFNTSNNIYLNGSFEGWAAHSNRNPLNANYGYNLYDTPLPVATAGYFDPQNRKALNIRNIALEYDDNQTYSQGWTMETYIQTTKKNQFIAAGRYLGDTTSSVSRSKRTGIRLKDGKIAFTAVKDSTLGFFKSTDAIAFTGFKDIADGGWHHLIIQYRDDDNRVQVWIDGELDVQRYGARVYYPGQLGYNSNDVDVYSDFNVSAISVQKESFVLERETKLNYFAAIGHVPFEATTATAAATLTTKHRARGNRGRALMLYFWGTFTPETNRYVDYYGGGPGGGLKTQTHPFDQGPVGVDPDTFYQLNTWIDNAPNKFYDWDIWPCPVVRFPSGESYKGDTHPILKDGITKSGTKNGTVYIDPVTDNYRYLDLMNDLKDLDQFDMICFRNYPDQSTERDGYGTNAKGVVDTYFNTLDKDLFEGFLKSLREAVDSGISLLITNPQLAIDLGFIETYASISDLSQNNDNIRSPKVAGDPLNVGLPSLNLVNSTTDPSRDNMWIDMAKNNRHKIVNEVQDLTTDSGFVLEDILLYTADGQEYGETGRSFYRTVYKPKLSVGDTFLTSDIRTSASNYFAVPFDKVKAGTIVTSFADTYYNGLSLVSNPYKNYATTIAVEPGTVVAGKQIGAKVFITFTDGVGNQQGYGGISGFGHIAPIEGFLTELKTDYWIDYAYALGAITATERAEYKANEKNLDRMLETGQINQNTYNAKAYWTLDGMNLIGQADAYGSSNPDSVDTADGVVKGKVSGRTRAGKRNTITSTSSLPAYTIKWSWLFPTIIPEAPSINTRGLWWLSERLAYETLPQRPTALNASSEMVEPIVSGYAVASINVQAAVANATIVETQYNSGAVKVIATPMTANAKIVTFGKTIIATPATASASLRTDVSIFTVSFDDVVLYVSHEDPILYIREDAIQ